MPTGIYPRTEKHKINWFKKGNIPWPRLHSELVPRGKNHYNWQGGLTKNKEWRLKLVRERRHRLGISKKYIGKYNGSRTKTKKEHRLLRKYNMKKAGLLTIQTIQKVYEDNIKRYGTLTCYLCLNPILFGEDHLEHKTPLSRGGTNKRDNLDIAHQRCNNKKFNKTEEEYRKEILI